MNHWLKQYHIKNKMKLEILKTFGCLGISIYVEELCMLLEMNECEGHPQRLIVEKYLQELVDEGHIVETKGFLDGVKFYKRK